MNKISEILSDLIAIRTDDKTKPNTEFVEYVCRILSEHHVLYKRRSNPNDIQENIVAGIGVQELKNINTGLVLSAHMDTVPANSKDWDGNPFQARLINNNIYGRGSVDMKYFIAVILSMIDELKKSGIPIFLLFSCDEETDVNGIQTLMSFLEIRNIKPKYALVGEPTRFNLCIANKGYAGYTTIIKGVSAHSGNPELGVNAAYIASKIVTLVEELNAQYVSTGTTLNVGVIQGGEGRNLVPSEVFVDWEIRYNSNNIKQELLDKIKALQKQLSNEYKNSHIYLKEKEYLPPFEKKTDSRLVQIAQNILKTEAFSLPYATEAGFFQKNEIETLICGAGDERLAHSSSERIHTDDLIKYRNFMIDFVHKIRQDLLG